jgi:hypothetical protein
MFQHKPLGLITSEERIKFRSSLGTLDELDDALGEFDPDAGSYPCPSTSGDIPPDFDGDSGESDEGADGDSTED